MMNIVQQVATSIGTAVMSVVLTNQTTEIAQAAVAAQRDPAIAEQLPPGVVEQGLDELASGFGTTFTVAAVLLLLAFVPALFFPRRVRAGESDTVEVMPMH